MNVPMIMDDYAKRHMAMPYGDIVAQKYKSVYLPLSATGLYAPGTNRSYYFQPDTDLDGSKCIIKGIELISSTEQVVMQGPTGGRDNLTAIQASAAILYISNIEREIIATLPLFDLIKSENDGKLLFTYLTNHLWQNCYVEFSDGSVISPTAGMQFLIYYDPK
jgi:hypothetical protein